MRRPTGWVILFFCALILVTGSASGSADEVEDTESDDALLRELSGLSGSDPIPDTMGLTDENPELFMFEQMPVVISASRREEPLSQSSVPISIISANDIHFSGQTQLTDMISFVPGVDVLPSDRNNTSVGIRGLHHTFADRTLILIDGRNAGDPVSGGVDFFRQTILPEDIKQIEIVRGPGGAAWGANAFNGVINFILKEPEDDLGVLASTTVNEYADTFTQVRWAHQIDRWSWRISGGYEDRESSDDAVGGDTFFSRDFSRNTRFNGQAVYRPTDQTKVSFGLGTTHVERGDFEFAGFPSPADPRDDEQFEIIRLHARLDHQLDPDTAFYLQWYGHFSDISRPNFTTYKTYENDLEVQLNLAPADDHLVSLGGNVRVDNIKTKAARTFDVFPDHAADEYWTGVFIIDRWEVNDRFALETQARVDWYSETGADWSGRLTGLWALDDEQRQVLRLSAAKAFRAPLHALRNAMTSRVPLGPPAPPGLFAINLVQPGDLGNEQIWSLEAGHQLQLSEQWTLRTDGYYQVYEDLIGARSLPDPLGLGRVFAQLDNIDGGKAFGIENELAYVFENVTLSLWHTWNDFEEDIPDQSLRAFRPAHHKAGVRVTTALPAGVTAAVNYRFTDVTPNEPSSLPGSSDVSGSHRLDLSVTKRLGRNAELLLGVTDLLDETDRAVTPVGSVSSHETPGRTFFFRFQISG